MGFLNRNGGNTLKSEDRPMWLNEPKSFYVFEGWIGVLLGVLLFSVGVSVDLGNPLYKDFTQTFQQCADARVESSIPAGENEVAKRATICREAVLAFDREAHDKSQFDWLKLLAEVLKTAGLGILASVVVAATVERRSRIHHFRELDKKTHALGQSVMIGMFNRDHPDRLLELVKQTILERDLIRSDLSIIYTLSRWEPVDPLGRLSSRKFIKVDVICNSTVRNVSSVQDAKLGSAKVALGLALPNPMIDELKVGVAITGFTYGTEVFSATDIAKANAKLQQDLSNDQIADASVDLGERELAFGGSVSISSTYSMIKESEDTEVFRTLQIAEKLHLSVIDRTGLGLQVRARAISHSKLMRQASSPDSTQWQLDDLTLPQQGIMVWWKQTPTPTAAAPATTVAKPAGIKTSKTGTAAKAT